MLCNFPSQTEPCLPYGCSRATSLSWESLTLAKPQQNKAWSCPHDDALSCNMWCAKLLGSGSEDAVWSLQASS